MHQGPREDAARLHADAHTHILRQPKRTRMQRLGKELKERAQAVQRHRHGQRRPPLGPQRRRCHVPEVRGADPRRKHAATHNGEEREVVQRPHRRWRAERRLPPDHHGPDAIARKRQNNA